VQARERYLSFPPRVGGFAHLSPTPLAHAPRFGPGVHLKHETFSLTASHKDRYHAVAARVAQLLGCRGLAASSTGNHGASAAAHAAAVGLRAIIFCHPQAPPGLLRAIGAFGGIAVQVPPQAQREELVALVADGWFPATSLDPVLVGAANPFGAEGYKAIAYEIVEQLDAMPEAVFVPTAGGDTYYGLAKGFAELAELADVRMPVVFAVQPEGASSLSQSLAAGRQVTLDQPASIALSIADPRTGRQAMAAVARWGGRALDVPEAEISRAMIDLATMGVYSDPASAAALAGYRHAIAVDALKSDATAVLLLTSSGFKWPNAMVEVFPAAAVRSITELHERLASDVAPAVV
jgi:threonine synthase